MKGIKKLFVAVFTVLLLSGCTPDNVRQYALSLDLDGKPCRCTLTEDYSSQAGMMSESVSFCNEYIFFNVPQSANRLLGTFDAFMLCFEPKYSLAEWTFWKAGKKYTEEEVWLDDSFTYIKIDGKKCKANSFWVTVERTKKDNRYIKMEFELDLETINGGEKHTIRNGRFYSL